MEFSLKTPFASSAAGKLIQHWKSEGLQRARGATEKDIQTFESRYNVILPNDFRDYFLSTNGMLQDARNECDHNGFGFYPLGRVKTVVEEYKALKPAGSISPNISNPQTYFVFVDYLQWCWDYAIHLSNDASESNEVIHVGTLEPKVVAQSFSEFVDLCVKDARELYPG
jgi:hypothetical protein